jgi:hypothetical protein
MAGSWSRRGSPAHGSMAGRCGGRGDGRRRGCSATAVETGLRRGVAVRTGPRPRAVHGALQQRRGRGIRRPLPCVVLLPPVRRGEAQLLHRRPWRAGGPPRPRARSRWEGRAWWARHLLEEVLHHAESEGNGSPPLFSRFPAGSRCRRFSLISSLQGPDNIPRCRWSEPNEMSLSDERNQQMAFL